MKTSKRRLLLILCLIMAIVSIPFTSFAANEEQLISENDKLALVVNSKNGEFYVKDKGSDYNWYSNPVDKGQDKVAAGAYRTELLSQIIISTVDTKFNTTSRTNSQVGCIKKGGLKIEKIEGGFKVNYYFPELKINVPVKYTLEEDYFKVEVMVGDIKEEGKFIVFEIELLPYFGAGGTKDSGYIFVPDGTGALINLNNGKKAYSEYLEPVYGKDNNMQQEYQAGKKYNVYLPVYGIKKDSNSFLSIIDKGDAAASIYASPSGKRTSYASADARYRVRSLDIYNLSRDADLLIYDRNNKELKTIEQRFYFLTGSKSNYSGMAERYRKYLIEEKGLKKQATTEGKFQLQVYGAVNKTKSVLGIPMETTEVLTTLPETVEILKALRKSGVDNISLKLSNWSDYSIDEKILKSAKPSRKLGGSKGLDKLTEYANKYKIRVLPDNNFMTFKRLNNPFEKIFNSAKTLSKVPAADYSFKLSTYTINEKIKKSFLFAPYKLTSYISGYMGKFEKVWGGSISVDSLTSTLYSDFSKKTSNRQDTIKVVVNSLKDIRKSVPEIMGGAANAYTLPYINYIADMPYGSNLYDIADETVPFYQMVVHGFIDYSFSPINLYSNEKEAFLKSIETGCDLQYVWIYRNPSLLKDTELNRLYSVNYRKQVKEAGVRYKEIKNVKSKVHDALMVSNSKLQEGVYETDYDNGVSVVVNYNDYNVEINGQNISGMGYFVFEGGLGNE